MPSALVYLGVHVFDFDGFFHLQVLVVNTKFPNVDSLGEIDEHVSSREQGAYVKIAVTVQVRVVGDSNEDGLVKHRQEQGGQRERAS